MHTASDRLRRKIELVSPAFATACTSLLLHPRLAILWPEYAIRTHWVIRATVPLMEDAEMLARRRVDDAVATGIAAFLTEHVEKERGHDDWILEDLELLGVARSSVLARLPTATVARLVGAQYYWLRHCHPVALLGYIAVMEGDPPTAELIDRLVAKSGYARAAFRAFAAHGELDVHHRQALYDAIDALPLTPEHEGLMGLAAMATVESLTQTVEEILDDPPPRGPSAPGIPPPGRGSARRPAPSWHQETVRLGGSVCLGPWGPVKTDNTPMVAAT